MNKGDKVTVFHLSCRGGKYALHSVKAVYDGNDEYNELPLVTTIEDDEYFGEAGARFMIEGNDYSLDKKGLITNSLKSMRENMNYHLNNLRSSYLYTKQLEALL